MKLCRGLLAAAFGVACFAASPLLAAPEDSGAADAEISGSVVATARQPILVTAAATSILRPGQAITITLSGEVDINQERKSKRKCGFLGLSCKRVYYTDHNFRKPGQLGATFVLRPKGGGSDLTFTVNDKPVSYQVPAGTDFRTSYDLLAALEGAGTAAIDGGRSVGAYKVRVAINGVGRANRYATWLASNPNVDLAVSDEVLDQITRSYGSVISAALRNHAKNKYPLAEPTNRSAHGKLVTKALMLAPSEPANALALADYYTAVGLTVEARNTLNAALALWNQQPEPRTPEAEQSLGEVYLKQARAALETRGGLDEQASLSAAVYLDRAAQRYEAGLRPDLAAAALVERARLLRSSRSVAALREATSALELALAKLPDYRLATATSPSSPGNAAAMLLEHPLVTIAPVDRRGIAVSDPLLSDALPIAYDPAEQMLIATDGTTLQWRTLGELDRVVANVDFEDMEDIRAAAGRILLIYPPDEDWPHSRRLVTAAKGGAPMMPVMTLDSCSAPLLSLAADGLSGTVGCNTDFTSFRFNGDTVQTLKDYHATRLLVAGNAGCGFLRISDDTGGEAVATLDRLDGTSVRLLDDSTNPFRPDWGGDQTKFAFADGRVLALREDGTLSSFLCTTGRRDRDWEIADVAQIEVGDAGEDEKDAVRDRWEGATLSWASPTQLAVRQVRQKWRGSYMMGDMVGARVTLIDWPSGSVAGFDIAEHGAAPWAIVEMTVLPPSAPGAAPRAFRPARSITASTGARIADGTRFAAGEWRSVWRLLAGGRYLLGIDRIGAPQLVDLASREELPPRDGLLSGPLGATDSWFDLGGSETDLGPVRLWIGDKANGERELPAMTPALRTRVLDDLREPADRVQLREFEDGTLVAETTLHLRYLPGLAIVPLSSGLDGASRLLCGIPVIAGDEEGRDRSVFSQSHEQISLLIAAENDIHFLALPPEQEHDCIRVRSLAGAQPGLLRSYRVNNTFGHVRISWWTGRAWTDVKTTMHYGELIEREFPDAAWTRADGSLLLLTHERYESTDARRSSDPEAGRRYQLRIAKPDGNLKEACKGCETIELAQANERWGLSYCPEAGAMDLVAVAGCALAQDTDFIRVDAGGMLAVYPLKGELVVRDLSTGKQLLRTPFGKPIDIDREKITVLLPADKAIANKPRLAIYRLP